MFSYTVAVYIYRYTMASAIMVFINCCSIESLKFILDSSGFVLYFTVGKYFGSRTMCHQNPFGDDFPFYFFCFLQFHSVPVINSASLYFKHKLNSIFFLSSTSLGFLMDFIPFHCSFKSYPRHFMVPQPSHPNLHQFLSLLLPKYVSDQSSGFSTWQQSQLLLHLLPVSAPLIELLKCKSDHFHCPEDI